MKSSFLFRLWSSTTTLTPTITSGPYRSISRNRGFMISSNGKTSLDCMLESTRGMRGVGADTMGKSRAIFLYDGRFLDDEAMHVVLGAHIPWLTPLFCLGRSMRRVKVSGFFCPRSGHQGSFSLCSHSDGSSPEFVLRIQHATRCVHRSLD